MYKDNVCFIFVYPSQSSPYKRGSLLISKSINVRTEVLNEHNDCASICIYFSLSSLLFSVVASVFGCNYFFFQSTNMISARITSDSKMNICLWCHELLLQRIPPLFYETFLKAHCLAFRDISKYSYMYLNHKLHHILKLWLPWTMKPASLIQPRII